MIAWCSIAGLAGWLISVLGCLMNPARSRLPVVCSAEIGTVYVVLGGESGRNEWYSDHRPPVGGVPPKGSIRRPDRQRRCASLEDCSISGATGPWPAALRSDPAISGEGQWSPVGRPVDGLPAVYETTLRPDAIHTSYVVGVAWMDTDLLKATLYSGSQIPGGGPFSHTAPIPSSAATAWSPPSTPGSSCPTPTVATTPMAAPSFP